jgi:hypothetical protein
VSLLASKRESATGWRTSSAHTLCSITREAAVLGRFRIGHNGGRSASSGNSGWELMRQCKDVRVVAKGTGLTLGNSAQSSFRIGMSPDRSRLYLALT